MGHLDVNLYVLKIGGKCYSEYLHEEFLKKVISQEKNRKFTYIQRSFF